MRDSCSGVADEPCGLVGVLRVTALIQARRVNPQPGRDEEGAGHVPVDGDRLGAYEQSQSPAALRLLR